MFFSHPVNAEWLKQQRDIMGTRISVELWHEDQDLAKECIQQAFAEMHRIDQQMSPYKPDSEVSLINDQAGIKAVPVSEELFRLIKRSTQFSDLSSGAFDITFASVGFHYDYRNKVMPDQVMINKLINNVNYRQLVLSKQAIQFKKSGMKIDLGGIAKGHAVDKTITRLKECGIQQAMVSAGGDSRIIGDHQGREWIIGIQHPRNKNEVALSIPLSNVAISTSGDYERYFLSSGERIHHIINPKTGRSANNTWSATVIGSNATLTDALSTTVFILGAKKGLELINGLADVDAIIIDDEAVMHYSSGLQNPDSSKLSN